ncbi:MAG: hypothetical protein LUG12_12815 [Erysipelotrichaceae bacterium]|nr:hypothetical protein [Erysipelotrichaceae bacterium]
MEKIKQQLLYVTACITLMLNSINTAYAASFDSSSAKSLIQGYTQPILNLLLWLLPTGCAIACLVAYISWLLKDEEEKERQKPMRRIKQIIGFGIIAECIVTILSIVGIS